MKNKKSLSKENNKPKKIEIKNNNILTRKKDSQKLYSSNNNTNLDYNTTKKESNNKLTHINLKSIIKKIDLFSLSLSKKYNNTNNIKNKIKKIKNKRPYTGLMKLKNNKTKNELNNEKHSYFKEIRHTKKNSLKKTDSDNIDFASLTSSENRYNKKNFISRYNDNNNINYNLNNNKKGRETQQRAKNPNNLYNIINSELFNLNRNNMNNNKKQMNQSYRRHFRRNNTELNKFGYDLKNSLNNMSNELKISKNNKKNKKNSSSKSKNILISNNNSTSNLNKKSKNINIIINDELKKYIFKGKSVPKDKSKINKKKLFLINYGNKIKSKHILQKENIKNSIPKPVSSNLELKLSKIQDDKLCNTEILKHAEFRANTSSTNFKEDDNDITKSIINKSSNRQLMENNYIDNALINIRGMSVPGKDTQNQIRLNQDSYIIKRDINNIKNFNIFGIFDGHGFYGHTISVYIKENLIKKIMEHPKIKLLNNLKYIYYQIKKNNFKIIKDIFNEIDYQLLNTKNEFDIKLSGSTCNILIQIGDNIICANTGDSRSLLIYENKNIIKKSDKNIFNNYQVFPLSYDCKPTEPKEKERILKKGGIITKIKDSFQNEIGPLRVFMKGSLLPGLTMSRSFGDKIGKDLGIISEPLINEYILNKDVKYIIMGSDGIWEFLSNEQVMNIGNKYYINNDPDNFCKQLIKKSTELWENNSRNIDDITLIVIFYTFL